MFSLNLDLKKLNLDIVENDEEPSGARKIGGKLNLSELPRSLFCPKGALFSIEKESVKCVDSLGVFVLT